MADPQAIERASVVKQTHEEELMALPNVVAVGVGLRHVHGKVTDEIAIIVSVRTKIVSGKLDAADLVPSELEGVPVDVQEVGILSAGTG